MRYKSVNEELRRRLVERRWLTVTEIAQRLGVGRPHVSNLLNGHHALSVNMALRIEAEFGIKARPLLRRQLDNHIEHEVTQLTLAYVRGHPPHPAASVVKVIKQTDRYVEVRRRAATSGRRRDSSD